jgi:hypothetical protein
MIERIDAPEGVLALRATGRIDERDVEQAIAIVEEALSREQLLPVFLDIDVSGMSPGAIMRDVTYGIGKLRELHRFPRVAVVTGRDWIRRVAQVQGRLIPQIEMRVFVPAERDEAMAWISQSLPPLKEEPPAAPSVRMIETVEPDLVAFEIEGRIRADDMRLLIARFEEAMKASEKLRVLVRIVDFAGVSVDALRVEGLASIKIKGLRQISRYAIVGGPDWMKTIADGVTPFVPVQTKRFERENEDEAWTWLKASTGG